MYSAATAALPAQTIRAYLVENGPMRVPFHNLLTSWELPSDPSADERRRIATELADLGVWVDRPLVDLKPEDVIGLSLSQSAPPSVVTVQPVPAPTAAPWAAAPPRRWVRRTLVGVAGVLALALAATGTFFIGRDTRLSTQEVDAKLAAQAKRDAGKAKAHEEEAVAAATKRAKRIQRRADAKLWRGRVERTSANARDAGYSAGSSAGYSAGNAAGFTEGHETGVEDGIEQGSDELTCSDDLDVPLPACP